MHSKCPTRNKMSVRMTGNVRITQWRPTHGTVRKRHRALTPQRDNCKLGRTLNTAQQSNNKH